MCLLGPFFVCVSEGSSNHSHVNVYPCFGIQLHGPKLLGHCCRKKENIFKTFLLLIVFSISMYIMCVILCLFSALSRRVGDLHISINIIIIMHALTMCLTVYPRLVA